MCKENNYATRCKICKKEWNLIQGEIRNTYSPDCSCMHKWNGNPQDLVEIFIKKIERET